jgi:hypothetical protein
MVKVKPTGEISLLEERDESVSDGVSITEAEVVEYDPKRRHALPSWR